MSTLHSIVPYDVISRGFWLTLEAVSNSAIRQAQLMDELGQALYGLDTIHEVVIESLLYDERKECNELCKMAFAWWALALN